MANKTNKVVHFDRLKHATVKLGVHKLSESKQELFSSSDQEKNLSNYSLVYQQPAKVIKAKINAATFPAPQNNQNARAVTPRKAKPAKDMPKASETPPVEAAPVAKQAGFCEATRTKFWTKTCISPACYSKNRFSEESWN